MINSKVLYVFILILCCSIMNVRGAGSDESSTSSDNDSEASDSGDPATGGTEENPDVGPSERRKKRRFDYDTVDYEAVDENAGDDNAGDEDDFWAAGSDDSDDDSGPDHEIGDAEYANLPNEAVYSGDEEDQEEAEHDSDEPDDDDDDDDENDSS